MAKIKKLKGEHLKAARRKHGLTQEQLAEMWGMDRPGISKLESRPSLTPAWTLVVLAFDRYGLEAFRKEKG